jgi:hypothetical protein
MNRNSVRQKSERCPTEIGISVRQPPEYAIESRPFGPQGKRTWKDGWFWIHRGDLVSLYVRVHGLAAARGLTPIKGGAFIEL